MAISGSLNFLSVSTTGSTDINIDFVGLNTLLVDPVTLSDNKIGYADTVDSETYYNNSIQSIGGPKPNQLNSLLLNRNGPYSWATWQQARNSRHPVARKLRLNNTISIDLTWPQKRNVHDIAHLNAFSYDNGSRTEQADVLARTHLSTARTKFTELKQYYEPSVDSKHKPFIYTVDIPEGPFGKAIARATLMNETSYFYNDGLNEKLKIKEYRYGGDTRPRWHKQKRHFDKNFTAAKRAGAKNFLYSERIFPKGINAGLPYKLEKPNYEEGPGTGSLGYDRNPSIARSFWRALQGGGAGSNVVSDGTTRMRTDISTTGPRAASFAMNSLDQRQTLSIRTLDTTTGSHAGRNLLISQSVGSIKSTWNILQAYTDFGVISHMNNVITGGTDDFGNPDLPPYRFFVQNETYSPYPITLLSMWPLDARQDLFGGSAKTKHLTGAAGGAGSQIGLTPHRSYQNIAGTTSGVTPLSTWSDYSNGNPRNSVNLSSQRRIDLSAIFTGSAGELAYSTKPTIFYFATGSRHQTTNGAWEGYHKPTASMQYNRHTFPYNTPFYATNLIRGKNPMFNSYAEFIGDNLKYFGRDYTVVPEFRISDHLDYYFRYFASHTIMNEGRNTYAYLDNPEQPDGDTQLKKSIFKRALHHQFPNNSTKLDFLTLDGIDITSSSGQALKGHLKDLSHTYTRYEYDQIDGITSNDHFKKERHYASEQDAVTFYEKHSHSDDLNNFTRLLDHQGGFTLANNTVPDHIKFTCHGIKKLLPYNGFYPVLRTMQIGKAFKDVVYDLLSTSPIYNQGIFSTQDKDAALQTILEPLFAPGVLYNSIKSGIAVDYPIYYSNETTPFGGTGKVLKGMPLYYTPAKFIASSSTGFGIASRTGGSHAPHRTDRISYEASSSFNYGGLYMMGSSRSIPAILNSKPTKRVPFEALYDLSKLDFLSQNGIKSLGGLHLTTDFIDLDRVDSSIWNEVYANYEGYDLNSAGKTSPYTHKTSNMLGRKNPPGQPARVDQLFSKNTSVEQRIYHSTINNFLCESMEFFLADVDSSPGVKLPVHSSGQVPVSGVEVEADVTFYMDVSLTMGRHQVMCEGPRNCTLSA